MNGKRGYGAAATGATAFAARAKRAGFLMRAKAP